MFVDRRPDAVRLVQENLALCGFTDRPGVKSGDALAYLKSGEKFDLIFLDPALRRRPAGAGPYRHRFV